MVCAWGGLVAVWREGFKWSRPSRNLYVNHTHYYYFAAARHFITRLLKSPALCCIGLSFLSHFILS